MFVKLLVLLFSNVFVRFSVLVCSKSLTKKCGLRVEISIRVLVSAIECTEQWSSAWSNDRVHLRSSLRGCNRARSTYTRDTCVALAHHLLDCTVGILKWLSAIECTCAWPGSTYFLINSTLIILYTLRLGGAFERKNCTVCQSLAFHLSFLYKLSFHYD